MENERNELPQNEDWLDEVLPTPEQSAELGPDEEAVSAAGLIHPDDMELEMILAEHREAEEEQLFIPLPEDTPVEPAFPDETVMLPEEFFNFSRETAPEETIVVPAVSYEEKAAEPVLEETLSFDWRSSFFSLEVGENMISADADNGKEYMAVFCEVVPLYFGI